MGRRGTNSNYLDRTDVIPIESTARLRMNSATEKSKFLAHETS